LAYDQNGKPVGIDIDNRSSHVQLYVDGQQASGHGRTDAMANNSLDASGGSVFVN